ncbi:MAG TPA: hypothetical protein VLQ93_14635 [Myxococcaceae bacterium]|nr:hypothetical protein [Myxococcaceae bacterium]
MKALTGVLGAALVMALTGCGGASNNEESMPNPGEEGGTVSAMASVTKTLYYEGACWWLKCANGNNATGACGYGCSDTRLGLARDYSWRLSCGQSVKVAANGRSANAIVWDSSCCGVFEGTDALLDTLAIPHGDGWCSGAGNFGYGYGQATATFTY